MPKIMAVFYNNDKKGILRGNFKEKLMNLLVIFTGILQAYNTRQVQHLFRLVKHSFRESMLKSTLYLFGRKKVEGGHTSKMEHLISPCHSPAFIWERGIE